MNAIGRNALALVVIAACAGFTATALSRIAFTMYDEGVYYYQAVLLTRGEIPYRDFFCPQPPGLLLIGAVSERIGAGIAGVRLMSWLCGIVLLIQTWRITSRIAGPESIARAACLAPALVAVTVVFAYQSIQGATNMPAACLELAACLLLLGEGKKRAACAGLVLAAATLLRLQALITLPGLLLLIVFTSPSGVRWPRAAWFSGAAAVGCGAIHGVLAAWLPGYFDNVVGFQSARVRVDWHDRGTQIVELLQEPVAVLGLLSAGWFAVKGEGQIRGIALHTLTTSALITVAGNSLSVMYYLSVLPLQAACATVALTQLTRTLPATFALLPLVIAAIRGPGVVSAILAQTAPNSEHSACIAAVRETRGDTVLTSDGRIAILAGKRGVYDYYATDPNSLFMLAPERFHGWFDAMLAKAEIIVITPQLLIWMSPANAGAVQQSGKPVLFDSQSSYSWFTAKCGMIQ